MHELSVLSSVVLVQARHCVTVPDLQRILGIGTTSLRMPKHTVKQNIC